MNTDTLRDFTLWARALLVQETGELLRGFTASKRTAPSSSQKICLRCKPNLAPGMRTRLTRPETPGDASAPRSTDCR